MAWTLLEVIWVAYVTILTCLMPYTKVEESFNMQAVHDLLNHGSNFSAYDHLEFPGVVPRTFLGPIVVAAIVKPVQVLFTVLDWRKCHLQLCVRLVMGWLLALCLLQFKRALAAYFEYKKSFAKVVARDFLLICLSQFHLAFYSSRLLPNVFALAMTLLALTNFLRQKWNSFIVCSGMTILIFRAELCLLFGPLLLVGLMLRQVSLGRVFLVAFPTLVASIGLSVCIDSMFWGKWIWPEGTVLWYNTVLNMSHNWGTQPFFWYFYSVLPRCVLASLPLALIGGMRTTRGLQLFLPVLTFVLLYSWLPHKELRFILYCIPLLNALAAVGLQAALSWGHKVSEHVLGLRGSVGEVVVRCAVYGHLCVNVAATVAFALASYHNYPGGVAMRYLHDNYREHAPFNSTLHICNYAAQSGVTRFLHENPQWIYNKNEGFEENWEILRNFTYLLVELKPTAEHSAAEDTPYLGMLPRPLLQLMKTHSIEATFSAYIGLTRKYPFVQVKETLALLRQRHNM